jgi:hypothetical protein
MEFLPFPPTDKLYDPVIGFQVIIHPWKDRASFGTAFLQSAIEFNKARHKI